MDSKVFLTKKINCCTVKISNIDKNVFKITVKNGTIKTGKNGYYSNGEKISKLISNENEVIINKSDLNKLGTYKLYINNEEFSIIGKWKNNYGKEITIIDSTDLYYYFNKPRSKYFKKILNR